MITEYFYEKIAEDINNWATTELERKKLKFNTELPAFMQLQNQISKSIISQPRKVSYSKIFKIPSEHQDGFNNLVKKIRNGYNINPYLSRRLFDADFVDGLLDFYDCYHFHLGEKKKGKFIKGTNYLALAIVNPNEVFFIDVQPHGDATWYSTNTLEIVHKERPELIEKFKVDFLKDISPKISDVDEVKTLRENGYNFAVTLKDGTSYMPAKFGQITMKIEEDDKNPNLAGIHFLKMHHLTSSIYFQVNDFIKKFKIINRCTITNAKLVGLKSDDNSNLIEFTLTIDYMKNLEFKTYSEVFSRGEL